MSTHVSYITIDSISEGVGSSQIIPLLKRLSAQGIRINLISFEKEKPKEGIAEDLKHSGIDWTQLEFGGSRKFGGLARLWELSHRIGPTDLIHARSDIPAVAGIISRKAPVLWDVRSLWADQRAFIETDPIKKMIFKVARPLESIPANFSMGMSSLTQSVVSELESRHRKIPKIQIVVPTAVDLDRFVLNTEMPSSFRGLYSGTYNNYYDLKLSRRFVEALQNLVEVDVQWARPRESARASLDAGESDVFIATQNEMAEILSQFSFGMSICRRDAGPSLKAAMPTKIAEFLACGRPMVVSKGIGDIDVFFAEFNVGVVIDELNDDLDLKARELIALLEDPDTPRRCRALAEKYFDIDKGVEKYISAYKSILDASKK
ncbi:MAG: hypothetical protein Q8K86_09905 [Candidatus Nanopelagicaceae bacterium]|nr:hypothetical protein [Candidatus Nanopelagicaceae bacterium]